MLDKKEIQINHEICLELLDKYIEVCEKNHINYYMACGSCLGAVRHRGFIPWDLNIDILMTVPEFRKLDTAMQKENLGELSWCCPEDRIYPLLTRANLSDFEVRPNVDVSVFANAPENRFWRLIAVRAAYFNVKMYKLKNTYVKRTFPFNVLKAIASIVPNSAYERFAHKLEDVNKDKQTTYKMVVLPYMWENRELIDTAWFGTEPVYGEFEGRKVRMLANTNDYLTRRYGDWMTPVVEEKGVYKHAKK